MIAASGAISYLDQPKVDSSPLVTAESGKDLVNAMTFHESPHLSGMNSALQFSSTSVNDSKITDVLDGVGGVLDKAGNTADKIGGIFDTEHEMNFGLQLTPALVIVLAVIAFLFLRKK